MSEAALSVGTAAFSTMPWPKWGLLRDIWIPRKRDVPCVSSSKPQAGRPGCDGIPASAASFAKGLAGEQVLFVNRKPNRLLGQERAVRGRNQPEGPAWGDGMS